jgi:hypothetical protein
MGVVMSERTYFGWEIAKEPNPGGCWIGVYLQECPECHEGTIPHEVDAPTLRELKENIKLYREAEL